MKIQFTLLMMVGLLYAVDQDGGFALNLGGAAAALDGDLADDGDLAAGFAAGGSGLAFGSGALAAGSGFAGSGLSGNLGYVRG